MESMVRYTGATTHINGFYNIYQTNKEAYQPCLEVHINYDKASTFQKDHRDESTHRPTQLSTTKTYQPYPDEYQNIFQDLDGLTLHCQVNHSL